MTKTIRLFALAIGFAMARPRARPPTSIAPPSISPSRPTSSG